jgi:DNA invertase Pin-like site-specific DNA recombinase
MDRKEGNQTMATRGYCRVSTNDQSPELQLQAMAKEVPEGNIYVEYASGKKDDRPQLEACLKALQPGDELVIWKLDRLGRSLVHLVNTVAALKDKGVSVRVLTGSTIDIATKEGRLNFGIFAVLAEWETELLSERTRSGIAAARARGRIGGGKPKLTKAQVRTAQSGMRNRDTSAAELAAELGITKTSLYRYVDAQGNLRAKGRRVMGLKVEEGA